MQLGLASTQRLGVTGARGRLLFQFVEELPRIRAVESSDANAADQGRVEVAQVYAVPGAGQRIDGLPVCHAAACAAVDRAKGFVALNVFGCGVGVTFNPDGSELEIDPRPTDPAA